MATSYSPKIITDGLVFCLDAGDRKSYSGSGTTWTDRSGNGNIGELVNTPTYNSSNLGYFQFSTNQFVKIPNNTDLDTQTPSVEVWVKINRISHNGFWFEKGEVNTQYSLFQQSDKIKWRQYIAGGVRDLLVTTEDFMNTTDWYQVVGTYTSGSRILYINGVQVNSDSFVGTIDTNSGGMSIGVYGGYAGDRGYYYNGNLAINRVYNRVLTPNEVLQNYNATKGRFGL